MKSTRNLGVILAMLSIAGCNPSDGPDEGGVESGVEAVQQAFKFFDSHNFNTRIQEFPAGNTFRICLYGTDVTTANRAGKETLIRNAAMPWVEAVRAVATVPLITAADITFNTPDPASGKCTGSWDLDLNWLADNERAVASANVTTGVAWMALHTPNGHEVAMHEFGHVFGLGDTYVEGVWTCQPGQPSSVMCNNGSTYSTLQPDDIDGIRAVFRAAFPGFSTLPAPLAWAGSEAVE